jgi:hypothetical protein
MFLLLRFLPDLAIGFFRSRRDLLLENLALRQQLPVVQERRPPPRFVDVLLDRSRNVGESAAEGAA